MNAFDIVTSIMGDRCSPVVESASASAPANVALCKYWGKRNEQLNLPITSSLSISLDHLITDTTVTCIDAKKDQVFLNGNEVDADSSFYLKVKNYCDLFRSSSEFALKIDTVNSMPTAAGLASSASGFAALAKALNQLFGWKLSLQQLSILARLGSGSASRSLWNGFVKWHKGVREDGMDCYAAPIVTDWSECRVGLLMVSAEPKLISSREAMKKTVQTSRLYQSWPQQVEEDMERLEFAIQHQDFDLLGSISESNALSMHATMLAARPAICYFLLDTIALMHRVWDAREQGLPVYFTEDAGPNLKLLYLSRDHDKVVQLFNDCWVGS